jgi:hypothetical protein
MGTLRCGKLAALGLRSQDRLSTLARYDPICAPSLPVPHVEARDVELQRRLALEGDALHDERGLGDGFFTRVTDLAVARTTPEPRDAVVRKPSVGELLANEETEGLLVHERAFR